VIPCFCRCYKIEDSSFPILTATTSATSPSCLDSVRVQNTSSSNPVELQRSGINGTSGEPLIGSESPVARAHCLFCKSTGRARCLFCHSMGLRDRKGKTAFELVASSEGLLCCQFCGFACHTLPAMCVHQVHAPPACE
jgi:hypothetical protein